MNYQLLPRLQESELSGLTESIKRFGVKVPVHIDENGGIIDGHHRVMIADSLGIEYPKTIEHGLTEAEKRILAAQLNAERRHMTMAQRVQLGREIEPDIAEVAEQRRKAQLKRGDSVPPRSGQLSGTGETRDEVARTVGIGSGRTYERNRSVLEELEQEEDGQQLLDHVRSGDWDIPDVKQELATRKHVHVANNSGENEWYTPPEYIEAAREVLNGIDLDPASNPKANEWIRAARIHTKDDNGLAYNWRGRVWMNPPYAQPLITEFCEKVTEEYRAGRVTEAIVLVNNATETRWFQAMAAHAASVCFPRGRIKYFDATGKPANTPLQGQAFVYFGENPDGFRDVFERFGVVL